MASTSTPTTARDLRDIERHIGSRMRERRMMLGVTQQWLAGLIGVSPQQVQKYERGIHSIDAGRLFRIAGLLHVPVSYFFEGLGAHPTRPVDERERLRLELVRNFAHMGNKRYREALHQIVRALAAERGG